jgi:putative ABC transport system substrate-binding protein
MAGLSLGAAMRRRDFIRVVVGSAAALPFATRAQETDRVRRIGVLMTGTPDDAEGKSRLAAFQRGLQELGWITGSNLQIDYRWANDNTHRRQYAAELIALAPAVILASISPSTAALQEATHTVPIVFAAVTDPVGQGFVASLPHPGGNITGFALYEYGISTKWLELLKEVAPHLIRVGVLRDPTLPFTSGELGAMQGVAPSLRLDVSAINVRDAGEIERGIATFARQPNGGLVTLGSPVMLTHHDLIVTLAARHRLPAIYTTRYFVTGGGLMSYGPDRNDLYRRAAGYVDRILRGEKPADLPVQAPTKYELIVNLKAAKALGLTVSPSLLARADEVLE